MTTIRLLIFSTVLALAATPDAAAQTQLSSPNFVSINLGAQIHDHTVATSSTFRIYEETAFISATRPIGAGSIFDVSGGRRVWRQLSAGGGVSRFSNQEDATVTATIPHPFFFNRAVTTTTTASELKHSELGIHLQALWAIPLTNNVEISVFAGPSFFRMNQDVVTTANVAAGTQNATPVTVSQSKTVVGANGGVDLVYRVTNRLGAGLLVRYAGGSTDLPGVENLKVGGGQIGAGLRVRF